MDYISADELSSVGSSFSDLSDISVDDGLSASFDKLSLNSQKSSSIMKETTQELPSTKGLRGIVYKMDHISRRALVRVIIDQDECHAVQISSDKYKPVDIHHLYIQYHSIGTGDNNIETGSVIEILEYKGRRLYTTLDSATLFTREQPAEIIKYAVNTMASVGKQNQLVAVTSVQHNYLKVVGSAYRALEGIVGLPRDALVGAWGTLPKHSFIYGEIIYLPKFYKIVLNEEHSAIPQLIYDHSARFQSIKDFENLKKGDVNTSKTKRGRPLLTRIRMLTELETKTIEEQTRNLEIIDYKLAVQYVRDPLLTCSYLEKFITNESVKEFTCEVNKVDFDVDKTFYPYRNVIYVPMNDRMKNCLDIRGRHTWQLGSDLVLKSEFFGSDGIPVVVDRINWERKRIRLVGGAGSESVFDAISRHRGNINWNQLTFRLGPEKTNYSMISETIRSDFDQFYNDRYPLFEMFVGRTGAPDLENIPKLEEDFYLQGCGKKLDESQRIAMRTTLAVPGFTCVSAPPGSGKTFLISGIVAAKLEEDPTSRFAICATTNIAVTNAIETVHSNYPMERKIRQFSRNAEADLDKNALIQKISLRTMTNDEDMVQSLMGNKKFAKAVRNRNKAQRKMQEQANTVSEQLHLVSAFQRAESSVGAQFIQYYAPTIYGTTGSIMVRHTHSKITHLIIDEATQMSQVDALSIYCTLPDLKQITVIGDSRQLGPFSEIQEGTLAHKIMKKGELTRLEGLKSSAKRELEYIYRSHPKIIDILLKPIYGPQLKAGTPASARNLAKEKNLPVALDDSPCLFIQVDGEEKDGRNKRGVEVVLSFLNDLRYKGVKSEDVSVICHHKAQKESLCQELKDRGNVGRLNLMYGVHTVDSFQGQEAKIVLVLTTKTCETRDLQSIRHIFSFVSDPQRETVAVSRAQHAVYIFGNWKQLAIMPFWSQFGPGIKKSGAIVNEQWLPMDKLPVGWRDDFLLNKGDKQYAKKLRRQLDRNARQ